MIEAGYCAGCFRTLEEITQWTRLSDLERNYLMNRVLPEREQASSLIISHDERLF